MNECFGKLFILFCLLICFLFCCASVILCLCYWLFGFCCWNNFVNPICQLGGGWEEGGFNGVKTRTKAVIH